MKTTSVRQRLTATYALSTMALLLAAVLAMRSYARHALQHQHELATIRSTELVRSFFRAEMLEYTKAEYTVAHVASELVFAGMGIDFLQPDGKLFASARPRGHDRPPAPPVVQQTVPLDSALAPGWGLRLRISIADLTAARQRIDRLTLVAIPLAVLLAAALAWFMTGRALAPVAAMAEAAGRLGGDPSSRLPVSDPNDEFGRLGGAFNGLLQRLEGVLMQQRRFLADAAHELRTPIARMLGESEARLADQPSALDRESLVRIRGELHRTSHLVDELLHMAQSDAGATRLERESLYLDDVVADAIAPWERELARRQLQLDVAGLHEARTTGDRVLLHRMIGVLLDNAARYTPDGGRIAVSVRPLDGRASLTVEDSGIGIPVGERATVFERFGRGAEARQRAPEGSGLGLAIAAAIARQHGGNITVGDSTLGGARFDVTLPAA